MNGKTWIACWLLVAPAVGADGLYKCTDPATGAVTFSQTQCAVDATTIDVDVRQPTEAQVLEAQQIAQRNQEYIDSGIERRRESLLAASRARTLARMESAREAERARIRTRRAFAANNLAGATYLNALSNDEAALDRRYEKAIDNLVGR